MDEDGDDLEAEEVVGGRDGLAQHGLGVGEAHQAAGVVVEPGQLPEESLVVGPVAVDGVPHPRQSATRLLDRERLEAEGSDVAVSGPSLDGRLDAFAPSRPLAQRFGLPGPVRGEQRVDRLSADGVGVVAEGALEGRVDVGDDGVAVGKARLDDGVAAVLEEGAEAVPFAFALDAASLLASAEVRGDEAADAADGGQMAEEHDRTVDARGRVGQEDDPREPRDECAAGQRPRTGAPGERRAPPAVEQSEARRDEHEVRRQRDDGFEHEERGRVTVLDRVSPDVPEGHDRQRRAEEERETGTETFATALHFGGDGPTE